MGAGVFILSLQTLTLILALLDFLSPQKLQFSGGLMHSPFKTFLLNKRLLRLSFAFKLFDPDHRKNYSFRPAGRTVV